MRALLRRIFWRQAARREAREDARRWVLVGSYSHHYTIRKEGGWYVRWLLFERGDGMRRVKLAEKPAHPHAADHLRGPVTIWEKGGPLPRGADMYGTRAAAIVKHP